MYTGYSELLAYEGLDDALDQVYRAYIDVRLATLAGNAADRSRYWAQVAEFRRAELDPGTLDTYPEKDRDVASGSYDEGTIKAARVSKAERARFLYWFDVRARFWWEEADRSLLDWVQASELEALYLQAAALEARFMSADAQSAGASVRRELPPLGQREQASPSQALEILAIVKSHFRVLAGATPEKSDEELIPKGPPPKRPPGPPRSKIRNE